MGIYKETEIDHIRIRKKHELMHYQQQHSDHIHLYGNSLILVRLIRKRILCFFLHS